ncbi:unnamed protein product, partial [Gadus morhua 'NCC']
AMIKAEGTPQVVDLKIADDPNRTCPDIADRLRLLEQEVARYRVASGQSKAEVERLMGALQDAEGDRSNRDRKISELESQINSPNVQKQMMTSEMKTDGLTDGHPHSLSPDPELSSTLSNPTSSPFAPSLPQCVSPAGAKWKGRAFSRTEIRNAFIGKRRSETVIVHTYARAVLPPSVSQNAMRETAERIRELELELRESMNTSAHKEALWAQEEEARAQAQMELEELMGALEKTRRDLDATKVRLSSTQQTLHERDDHLHVMRQERRKQLEEILEMKQQALVAAISEKDANIALLELSSNKRKKAQEEVMALKREKDRLMHQLKQQTQSRMKLISENYEEDHHHPHPHPQPHHPHHQHPQHPQHPQHRYTPNTPNTRNTPNTTLTSTINITPTRCISTTGVSPGARPMPTTGPPWTRTTKKESGHDRHLPVRRRWLHFH